MRIAGPELELAFMSQLRRQAARRGDQPPAQLGPRRLGHERVELGSLGAQVRGELAFGHFLRKLLPLLDEARLDFEVHGARRA
jgi:hypothetical protein